MDTVSIALLDSWDRQVQMLTNLANIIDESNRHLKPAEGSWGAARHLAHVHHVRKGWLSAIDEERANTLGDAVVQKGDEYVALDDLDEIRRQLDLSAKLIRDTVAEALENGTVKLGPYDHPVLLLQHMVWHEGWHFGLISLALRNAGLEPDDEWQEKNIWELWRGPEEE